MIRTIALVATISLLASCASGPPRMSRQAIDRALVGAPGMAQPSKIVAAELAFARAAQDDGQWTAFREFMGPGALIHGRNGPFDAGPWLSAQSNPPVAVKWAARSVWMSCDGTLAISRGRFLDPQGEVGTFITLWQQQENLEYRWIYDLGAPDDPQPAAAEMAADAGIVVSAEDLIQGYVADCPGEPNLMPAPTMSVVGNTTRYRGGNSPDGTLRWRWEHRADGTRRFYSQYFSEGIWQTAVDHSIPPQDSE
uniref:hypothetical protein n=1 Tax=Parerythrobacter lutipelagi TaxID=1964208 RepID=UPI0010F72014|nr:hypothetical protein [Parerythrobacter lutipelagi]